MSAPMLMEAQANKPFVKSCRGWLTHRVRRVTTHWQDGEMFGVTYITACGQWFNQARLLAEPNSRSCSRCGALATGKQEGNIHG